VIEDVAAVSALNYEPVSTKNRKLLRDTGMGDAESLCKTIYVDFASTKFFDNTNAIGMGKNSKEFGKLFTDKCPSRHSLICKYLHICTGAVKKIKAPDKHVPRDRRGDGSSLSCSRCKRNTAVARLANEQHANKHRKPFM
jgi:hypothetical protein